MHKPIHLTFPPPTPEELEKRYRISKARKKELQALVDEFVATPSNREELPLSSIEPEERRKSASAA
jgi:DNA-binding PadR family transcriptional regulator